MSNKVHQPAGGQNSPNNNPGVLSGSLAGHNGWSYWVGFQLSAWFNFQPEFFESLGRLNFGSLLKINILIQHGMTLNGDPPPQGAPTHPTTLVKHPPTDPPTHPPGPCQNRPKPLEKFFGQNLTHGKKKTAATPSSHFVVGIPRYGQSQPPRGPP